MRIKNLLAGTPAKADSFPFDGSDGTRQIATKEMLSQFIDKASISAAAFHNSIYQDKDITSYVTDGTIWDRIAGTNGFAPFDGIYPGNYIKMSKTVTAPGSSTTGTNIVKVAGCNCHWNNYGGMRYNCLTMVPATHFGKAQMNSSNTTEGAYVGSNMYKNIIGSVATSGNASGTINEQLYSIFGAHLKTSKELLANSMDSARYNRFGQATGASSSWDWYDTQAVLMSEVEVYGSTVWSSSGYDTGTAKSRLPIFAFSTNDLVPDGIYYWLKDVASAVYFCHVSADGRADYVNASDSYYVRPRFIIA
jgi:hypothetical protein